MFLTACCLFPSVLSSNISRLVLSPVQPSRIAAIDIAAAARVCYCESRNQSHEGQIAAIDVLRNRATEKGVSIFESSFIGICRGKLERQFVKLASEVLKQPPSHSFLHFINFDKATDRDWIEFAKTQSGNQIDSHFFF